MIQMIVHDRCLNNEIFEMVVFKKVVSRVLRKFGLQTLI